MENTELIALKFPVGKFERENNPTTVTIAKWIDIITELPEQITKRTHELTTTELNWAYRPDGWTIQQVVHHLADSHMNSFIRFKLALTEDSPIIRPYHEDRWAKLTDVTEVEIGASLDILRGVHRRWSTLLRSLNENDRARTFIHPDHNHKMALTDTIGLYAWHCSHHLAHIDQAFRYKGKF